LLYQEFNLINTIFLAIPLDVEGCRGRGLEKYIFKLHSSVFEGCSGRLFEHSTSKLYSKIFESFISRNL